jgi:hypothetical protein
VFFDFINRHALVSRNIKPMIQCTTRALHVNQGAFVFTHHHPFQGAMLEDGKHLDGQLLVPHRANAVASMMPRFLDIASSNVILA